MSDLEVQRSLGRIEASVEAARQDIAEHREESNKRADHHSKRLGSLEKTRARILGAGSVVTVLATGFVGWFIRKEL